MPARPDTPEWNRQTLRAEAAQFAEVESTYAEPSLYGVTDGKAIGTYLEHKFRAHLQQKYTFDAGNSASGIDFPDLNVDMKVTSVKQPQSSCPFKSALQKVFGLGYALLVFVYEKRDDPELTAAVLNIKHCIWIEDGQTADFQMTTGLRRIAEADGNVDDIDAFLEEKNLPVDPVERRRIAERILADPPPIGYLTISNALQWRLQYGRAITQAGESSGVEKIR